MWSLHQDLRDGILVSFLLRLNGISTYVGQMATRAQQITAESLGGRLPIPNPHDELGQLAVVFNAMCGDNPNQATVTPGAATVPRRSRTRRLGNPKLIDESGEHQPTRVVKPDSCSIKNIYLRCYNSEVRKAHKCGRKQIFANPPARRNNRPAKARCSSSASAKWRRGLRHSVLSLMDTTGKIGRCDKRLTLNKPAVTWFEEGSFSTNVADNQPETMTRCYRYALLPAPVSSKRSNTHI